MICPKCNQTVEEGAKFCTNCGASLEEAVKQEPEQVTEQVTKQEAEQVTEQEATQTVEENPVRDRKSTRLNSSHTQKSRMPSSA